MTVNPEFRPDPLQPDSDPPSPPPEPASTGNRFIDRWTLVVLAIAALVAGSLSASGAHAMFPGGWAIPVAFATVVQIVVSMSLWALPRRPFVKRALLLTAWFIAVNFSIASAFYANYLNNSQELTASLVTQVGEAFTTIKVHTQAVESGAGEAQDRMQSELDHGTFSVKGVPGEGPKTRELRQVALTAVARAREAKAVDGIVDDALESLKQPDMTVEKVRDIYQTTLYRVGKYAEGVPRVSFGDDRRSFVNIVASAYTVLAGQDTSVSPVERTRILGSFGSASLMEVLALLSSIIRMEMHRDPRRRGDRRGWLDGVFALINLPQQVRDSMLLYRLNARESSLFRGDRWRQSRSDFVDAAQGEKPEGVWSDMLAHVAGAGPRAYHKTILELLPNYSGTRRGPATVPVSMPGILFDARVFENKPVIVQVALNTLVIVRRADGSLAAGPRWQAWIRFLIGALAGPPPPGRRQNGASGGKPKLRVVGGSATSKVRSR
jgi:hypothetical protein